MPNQGNIFDDAEVVAAKIVEDYFDSIGYPTVVRTEIGYVRFIDGPHGRAIVEEVRNALVDSRLWIELGDISAGRETLAQSIASVARADNESRRSNPSIHVQSKLSFKNRERIHFGNFEVPVSWRVFWMAVTFIAVLLTFLILLGYLDPELRRLIFGVFSAGN